MFGSLGFAEILFILILALLVFGPRRLPEIGRTIGRALGEFRRATNDLKRSIDTEIALEEPPRPRPAPVPPADTLAIGGGGAEPQPAAEAAEPEPAQAADGGEVEPPAGDAPPS